MNALLAELVVAVHFLFVLYVVFGGLLTLRWPRLAIVHLPAVAWGIYVQLSHTICPLTPLENRLRDKAGLATYDGGFIAHYIYPVLYPTGLTPQIQYALAAVLATLNIAVYAWLWRTWLRHRASIL